jgi:hypothetical protein
MAGTWNERLKMPYYALANACFSAPWKSNESDKQASWATGHRRQGTKHQ